MTNLAVLGCQWGDEGKGKVIDYLAPGYDIVVRYQGGHNSGHTVFAVRVKYKLHHVPSGIVSGKRCVIGNGMVIEPKVLIGELDDLKEKGIGTENLYISTNAHMNLPYHAILDGIHGGKIGTTKRGIGQCYGDKMARVGIRMGDMRDGRDMLREKVEKALEDKNFLLEHKYNLEPFDVDKIVDTIMSYRDRLVPMLADTPRMLAEAIKNGDKILFEGAQGMLLDIDHGTYPYVTSSSTTAGGISTGSGVGPRFIHNIMGVVKAYVTRVGNGPFPTELGDPESPEFEAESIKDKFTEEEVKSMLASGDDYLIGKAIRVIGEEYGTSTERPRRVGYPDMNILKKAVYVNSVDSWAITKLDVLDGIEFPIAVDYDVIDGQDGKPLVVPKWDEHTYEWPHMDQDAVNRIIHDGFSAIPDGMQAYLIKIAELTRVPVSMISLSPDRIHTMQKDLYDETSKHIK